MNIHTELPIGSKSQGYDRATLEEADIIFNRMVRILNSWSPGITIDVVLSDDAGVELRRVHVINE